MRPRSMQLRMPALELRCLRMCRGEDLCAPLLALGSGGHCRRPTETPWDSGRPCMAREQTRWMSIGWRSLGCIPEQWISAVPGIAEDMPDAIAVEQIIEEPDLSRRGRSPWSRLWRVLRRRRPP